MAYPGNTELSPRAQERVMSAFRLVISNLQDNRKDDALVGLDFVLRLDPSFTPALALQEQLSTGDGKVSLEGVLSQIDAPATEEINLLLVEAIEEFEKRHLVEAQEKVRKVLLDLPGHEEARNLSRQIEDALEKEAQVGHFLTQAREALDAGDPQEAANFVMMAQTLDPHHPGIHATLEAIQERGKAMMDQAAHGAAPVESAFPAPPSPVSEAAMPQAFELEGPDEDGFGAGAQSTPAEEGDEGSLDFESSGVGDLFEDIGTPPDEGLPPLGDLFETDDEESPAEPMGLDPGAQAAYAASADDWKQHSQEEQPGQPAVQPVEEHPPIEEGVHDDVQETEEASWGPDFDNFGDDVSDLFSSDSVSDVDMEAEPEPVEELPALEQGTDEPEPADAEFGQPAAEFPPPAVQESEVPLEEAAIPEGGALEDTARDEEEDLFSDDFSVADELDALEARSRQVQAPAAVSRGISLKMVGLGVLALLVLLGGMWLGLRLMGSGNSDENRARAVQKLLEDADGLMKQGKSEEALHLLENFQADDIEKQRIDKHIARIREAMAPPTPTPVPEEAVKARDMLARGDWLGALEEIQKGLSAHPQDPGLQDLKTEIARREEQAMPLFTAMKQKEYRSVVSIASGLEMKYPGEKRISDLVDRYLFNGALKELRSYNLAGARAMLVQLHERRPDDAEVARILKFSEKYIKKPVDMQLEIFVGSIKDR